MTEVKASGGNISLVKNAARDKNGKRKGNFSQVDHSINALAAKIGLDGYGIYHFLLNNAGGNFEFSATSLLGIFKKDIPKSRIYNAIDALEDAGLLEKEKIGQKGKRPLYAYRVYEVSTKQQPATAHVTDTQKQELSEIPQQLMPSTPQIDLSISQTELSTPKIDTSDFSAEEINQAIHSQNIISKVKAPAHTTLQPSSLHVNVKPNNATKKEQITNERKQRIYHICQSTGAFSQIAKDKVIKCCSMYYTENRQHADDTLIAQFANLFSADSTQTPATVYKQVVVM